MNTEESKLEAQKQRLDISDIMCSDFEKELIRHNFYITLIHKELMKGIITKDLFFYKQKDDIKTTSKILCDIVRNYYI